MTLILSSFPLDEDQKPKSEQPAAAGSPGGAAAEPSTSQPAKTEEATEKAEESKVKLFSQKC